MRAGEASNRVDAMTQVIATGRELARRDDGSVVNETAHIRIGTELEVVAGFDNPHLSDENCAAVSRPPSPRSNNTPARCSNVYPSSCSCGLLGGTW